MEIEQSNDELEISASQSPYSMDSQEPPSTDFDQIQQEQQNQQNIINVDEQIAENSKENEKQTISNRISNSQITLNPDPLASLVSDH
jgi:hypothetical protein